MGEPEPRLGSECLRRGRECDRLRNPHLMPPRKSHPIVLAKRVHRNIQKRRKVQVLDIILSEIEIEIGTEIEIEIGIKIGREKDIKKKTEKGKKKRVETKINRRRKIEM